MSFRTEDPTGETLVPGRPAPSRLRSLPASMHTVARSMCGNVAFVPAPPVSRAALAFAVPPRAWATTVDFPFRSKDGGKTVKAPSAMLCSQQPARARSHSSMASALFPTVSAFACGLRRSRPRA